MIRTDIAVLGGGIAGTIAAALLARQGRRVHMVTRIPTNSQIEGQSPRAVEALRAAGMSQALAVTGPWVDRFSHWNGQTVQANGETLTDRARLDAALVLDTKASGATVTVARVGRVEAADRTWRINVHEKSGQVVVLEANFLVEARGRRAPFGRYRRRHGPSALALTRTWRVAATATPMSAVAPFADGWAWFAHPGTGQATLQIVVADNAVPKHADLEAFYGERFTQITEARDWLAGAVPTGSVAARNANAVLAPASITDTAIRIGDAAVAIDPLSGHGQFVAASTALAAPAVIATLCDRPVDTPLAQQFYLDRVEESFLVQARVGRDFYRYEQRWKDRPFWHDRAAWPDEIPAHPAPNASALRSETRPVIDAGYVVAREVVVTADHPRGVWRISGVPLVPLMRFVGDGWHRGEDLAAAAAAQLSVSEEAAGVALAWLNSRGLLASRPSFRDNVDASTS